VLHPHEEYGRDVLESAESLVRAMNQAHGAVEMVLGLTVREFILVTASNGIRFTYKEPVVCDSTSMSKTASNTPSEEIPF